MDLKYSKAITQTTHIIDAWLPTKMLYGYIPGISIGIVHNGRLIFKKGYGYADVEGKKKVTPETNFRIASNSKMFTAVALLQLAEQKKLSLDDTLSLYIPWLSFKGSKYLKKVTIRQVLSHTSGLFRDGTTPHWVTTKFPSIEQLRKELVPKMETFENLTQFKYSNFAYGLLGEVVRSVSGLSYERYLQRYIFQPLGMQSTSADIDARTKKNLAVGYGRVIPGIKRQKFGAIKTMTYAPATGLTSNVLDLAGFISALSLKSKKSILSRESKKEMFREHWATGDDDEHYGLGVMLNKIKGRKIIGHTGGFPGHITSVSFDSDNDIGVIVLTNSGGSNAPAIADGIFETIYYLFDKQERFKKQKKAALTKFEGLYRNRWGDIVIAAVSDKLLAFSPELKSPSKEIAVLKPTKKPREFIIDEADRYSLPGELAVFTPSRKGRRGMMLWGSHPLEKIV